MYTRVRNTYIVIALYQFPAIFLVSGYVSEENGGGECFFLDSVNTCFNFKIRNVESDLSAV